MKRQYFLKLMEDSFERIRQLESEKRNEYTTEENGDRLSHFKEIGAITGEPAHQALRGMMVKHTKSVYDMLKRTDPTKYNLEIWEEKILDHNLYFILLLGIIKERQQQNVKNIPANVTTPSSIDSKPNPYDKFSSKSNPEKTQFTKPSY